MIRVQKKGGNTKCTLKQPSLLGIDGRPHKHLLIHAMVYLRDSSWDLAVKTPAYAICESILIRLSCIKTKLSAFRLMANVMSRMTII
jgi:hypothetical protein